MKLLAMQWILSVAKKKGMGWARESEGNAFLGDRDRNGNSTKGKITNHKKPAATQSDKKGEMKRGMHM